MKKLLFIIVIFNSFSAYAGNIECYHSHSKRPVCGYMVDDEQMRSCRIDIYGRDRDDRKRVLSIYLEGRYEATDNRVLKYYRIRKTEKAIAKKLDLKVQEIKNSLNPCAF